MKNDILNNFITDEQLTLFLDAKEAGRTYADALGLLHLKELSRSEESEMKAYWEMHERMSGATGRINAPESLVHRILGEKSPFISNFVASFPEAKEEEKAIASPYARTVDYLKRPIRSSWKIAAPIAVIFFALVGMLGMKGDVQSPETPVLAMNAKGVSRPLLAPRSAAAPESADSVDEILSTLSSEADSDVTLLADANTDLALVEGDAAAANELHNAYDETTF